MRGDVSWKNYYQVENGKVDLYKAFVRGTRDRLIGSDPRSAHRGPRKTQSFSSDSSSFRGTRLAGRGTLLKLWRDQIIRDLAQQEKMGKVKEYTSFIDEAVSTNQKSPFIPEWRVKVEHFVEGLRKLESQGQLTEQNILNLFKPSTHASPDYAADVPGTFLNAANFHDVVARTPVTKEADGRSEVRATDWKKIGKKIGIPAVIAVALGLGSYEAYRYFTAKEGIVASVIGEPSAKEVKDYVELASSATDVVRKDAVKRLLEQNNPKLTLRVLESLSYERLILSYQLKNTLRSWPGVQDPAIDRASKQINAMQTSITEILEADPARVDELFNSSGFVLKASAAKVSAIRMMGARPGREIVTKLDELTRDSDIDVRIAAIYALGTIKDDRAAEAYGKLQKRLDEEVERLMKIQAERNKPGLVSDEFGEILTSTRKLKEVLGIKDEEKKGGRSELRADWKKIGVRLGIPSAVLVLALGGYDAYRYFTAKEGIVATVTGEPASKEVKEYLEAASSTIDVVRKDAMRCSS